MYFVRDCNNSVLYRVRSSGLFIFKLRLTFLKYKRSFDLNFEWLVYTPRSHKQ